jgi:phage terminase large subunit-like protein
MGAAFDPTRLRQDPQAALALRAAVRRTCERSFTRFVWAAWPVIEPSTPCHWNWHMDVICGYLEALHWGHLREPRLIINVPPGTSKSLLVSVLYPAWVWAQDPGHRFLTTSNDGAIVVRDALKHRYLVQTAWYRWVWGDVVEPDASQWDKTLFQNTKLGFRQAVPLRGTVTGKRGDTQIIDDPHDAKKAFSDAEILSDTMSYDNSLSTRVNNAASSRRLMIMQRLRTNDMTGHLLGKTKQAWVHVSIPMEYEGRPGFDVAKDIKPAHLARYRHLRDPRKTVGELLDPVRFPRSAVEALKEDLGEYGAAGQLQQRPQPLGGGLIKSKWWRVWDKDRPLPEPLHVFCSWDTAYTEKDYAQAAFSGCLDWAIFWHEEQERHCLLLLDAWWERVAYPDLRRKAKEKQRERQPDAHLIEQKASGLSMIQDLRRARVAVRGYDPRPDGDKIGRLALASASFEAGLVWIPDRKWARQVVQYVAEAPTGAPPSADIGDMCSQAVRYLTKRWWLEHPDDAPSKAETLAADVDDEDDDEAQQSAGGGVYG